MTDTTLTPRSGRMPSLGRVLLQQVRHHLRLMLRTPRAISTGLVLPVLLLLLSGTSHGHLSTPRLAGLAVLGLTMTAWTTHGIGLVAAREAGVLERWRARPPPAVVLLHRPDRLDRAGRRPGRRRHRGRRRRDVRRPASAPVLRSRC